MNNLKKVGLTALAGSLVAFSAQALEMSVSGSAKITYVDEGKGSAGNTDVTGNPYGFDQALAFNGSGDSDLGTVSVMHVLNVNGPATSSSLITIDMGDAGKISLDGGGNSIRSFIYIDDVSRALSMLLKKGKVGYTYHISTNKFVSVKKLVNNIFRKMKISKKNIKDVNDRLGKDHSYKLSSDLIRKEINWKAKINLNEGLKRTINWVNQNFNTLKNHKTKYIHKK